MSAFPSRLSLMGFPLDAPSLPQTLDLLSDWMFGPRRGHTVVTLNPEFIVQARSQPDFARALAQADLVTADGIGIVWAARQLLGQDVPRAPGVDIARGLLQRHGPELRVYFLGGQPGVAERAAQEAFHDFGTQVAGHHHGYFGPEEDSRVIEAIAATRPHLLLTGMGAARQELFNERCKAAADVPVLLGCGGTLDVLAGTAQLAPAWTRRAGLEFAWRIASDRRRWGRAPRLAEFVRLVLREKSRQGR
ncbi:WecB/TagA/CpsF family glycosyltransferase [Deinococcus lacus]|uniref:WecB/TagA/CpsF family glycosyltransferase n=1 Tax=Deinococcus lacus TaxID=392561 RepID=A0ABW1YGJ4_9DEIO